MESYWSRYWRRRVSRRAVLGGAAAGAAGLGALALAGCGDDDDDDVAEPAAAATEAAAAATEGATEAAAAATEGATEAATEGATEAATEAAAPAGGPISGGTFNISGAAGAPDVFDPAITILGGTYSLGLNKVFSRIVKYGPDFSILPDICEPPEQPDSMTYIFNVRPNVYWHDLPPTNGRKFTAEDAAFGVSRFANDNPEFIFGSKLDPVEGHEVIDESTYRLTTKFPFAPMLTVISDDAWMMVNREQNEAVGDEGIKFYENLVGTGPWLRGELEVGVKSHLTRNPNFYEAGQPYLDRINFVPLSDRAARDAAFRTRQIDASSFITGLTKLDVEALQDEFGDSIQSSPKVLSATYDIDLNHTREPFGDKRVRKALHLAADRDQFQNAWGKEGGLLMSAVPQFFPTYGRTQQELYELPGYRQPKDQDIAEAKKLLEAAGHGDGLSLTTLKQGYIGNHAIPFKENLKAVGIDLELNEVPTGEWIVARQKGDFDMVIASNTGAIDPDFYLSDRFHSEGTQNYGHYVSDEFDALAVKQRGEVDIESRAAVIREADDVLLEDAPHIFSANIVFHPTYWSYLKDVVLVAGLSSWTQQLWIDPDEKARIG